MQLRLGEIFLDRRTKCSIREIPVGWRRLLKPFGYKKIYLSERRNNERKNY